MKTRTALLLPALLVACQTTDSQGTDHSVRYLVAQGHYKQAVTQARAAWEARPEDAQVSEDYQLASVAFLLERGRQRTFAGQDVEALEDFEAAVVLDPEAEQPQRWMQKTRWKLSDLWYREARDRHASDRLLSAAEAYQTALDYDVDNMAALDGLYRVGVQLGYREGLSEDYYNEGLQALRDHRLWVSRSRFGYAGKYREGDPKPPRRMGEVDTEIASEFAVRGLDLEAQGFYAAAKNEFRVALVLDETNQVAQQGFERMQLEAEVHEQFKAGEMWIRRGEWDKAVEVLEAGLARTAVQHEDFQELIASIDDLRAKAAYQGALNLEHDFRYVEAIRAYGALLEERGFFEDARARLSRLEQVVTEVELLYAGLASITDEAELLAALQRIDVLWPEYRDVQDRLDALD